MFEAGRILGLAACAWLALIALVLGDDAEAIWRCPYTQDGACIPNARSFGYYPTRWRKWPGAKPTSATAEGIATPTPAKAEPAKPAEPEEELPPKEETPAEEPPSGAAESAQPKEPETQPELPEMPAEPRARPGAGESRQPQTRSPEPPAELNQDLPQPPNMESLLPDEPPAPPGGPSGIPADEDPFKDDPLPSEENSPSGARQRSATSRSLSQSERVRWRRDPRFQRAMHMTPATQLALADAGRKNSPATPASSPSLFKSALSRSNPLRGARGEAAPQSAASSSTTSPSAAPAASQPAAGAPADTTDSAEPATGSAAFRAASADMPLLDAPAGTLPPPVPGTVVTTSAVEPVATGWRSNPLRSSR